MPRTTIDYGIDLGTTNSAIAALNGTELEVILNRVGAMLTPSALYIDRRGQVHVGQPGKDKSQIDPGNCDFEFKTRMRLGEFGAKTLAGRTMRPQDSSAEVLKSLRDDVRTKKNEDITAAVITIPADFSLPQCSATSEAAQLAGFMHAPLLLEPVAAATAYGFREESEDAYWLVYDFGGGTFDAAVMRVYDGQIQVVEHAGDNYLGGKLIDWEIVEKIFIPRLAAQYRLPDFHRGNPKWSTAMGKMKGVAERAKIEVSRTSEAYKVYLDDPLCDDADGRPVDLELDLTPKDVATIAAPFIGRSINLSLQALAGKGLRGRDMARVIMVGGTSLYPELRRQIQAELETELDVSIDPMTVVARGAAVFASTQVLPRGPSRPSREGSFDLKLDGPRMGPDDDPKVTGTLTHPRQQSLDGYTVEFVDQKTQWSSGRIPLRNGSFETRLHADKGRKCEYAVVARDKAGTRVATNSEDYTYVVAMEAPKPTLPRSIGVHTASNQVDIVFKKGDPLPYRKRTDHITAHPFRRGQSGAPLTIPLVQGEQPRGDRNARIGGLVVECDDLKRDLPAGIDVFITVEIDESQNITLHVEVPFANQEFSVRFAQGFQATPLPELKKTFADEVNRKQELERKARMHSDTEAMTHLATINREQLEEQVRSLLQAAEGDAACLEQAEEKLLQLQIALDRVEEQLDWPLMVAEANSLRDACRALVPRMADVRFRRLQEAAEAELSRAIASRDGLVLKRRMADLEQLKMQMLGELPETWVELFMQLTLLTPAMSNPTQARTLIDLGNRAKVQGNVEQLRSVVVQLIALLPEMQRPVLPGKPGAGSTVEKPR